MLRFLKRNTYSILIIIIVSAVAYLTYRPNTFLTGWDTLHPELNFSLNFERMFNGVWREEQGLGAVAGHSHMADLPRVVILWLLHFALPLSSLRYFYVISLIPVLFSNFTLRLRCSLRSMRLYRGLYFLV